MRASGADIHALDSRIDQPENDVAGPHDLLSIVYEENLPPNPSIAKSYLRRVFATSGSAR